MVKPKLFLADDSSGDALLLRIALADSGLDVEFDHVLDGNLAYERLLSLAFNRPFPYHVVIIDLNLPKLNGLELLDRLREQPHFEEIPVFILTSSNNPSDRLKSLKRRPTAYLCKPDDFKGMSMIVAVLAPYLITSPVDRVV